MPLVPYRVAPLCPGLGLAQPPLIRPNASPGGACSFPRPLCQNKMTQGDTPNEVGRTDTFALERAEHWVWFDCTCPGNSLARVLVNVHRSNCTSSTPIDLNPFFMMGLISKFDFKSLARTFKLDDIPGMRPPGEM